MIPLTMKERFLRCGCECGCTVLWSTCNIALWECHISISPFHNVTWSCFDQSAEQFVVDHTTK